ncbi:hypothetical protein MTR67_003461 [Solanum verrucosum]|uniref:protein-synthesizing GTPase n=2 Tax=Solanum TaxID=4107 RepID=A0AAF0PWV8_SOLVR|nr:hypothetical protein MTR67_003461 [Solanum verrucosum]
MSRKGLMEQDLSKLDVTQLHPLSPEVISRQATINIGTIGHVAHGKSTVVKAISGVQVQNLLPSQKPIVPFLPNDPPNSKWDGVPKGANYVNPLYAILEGALKGGARNAPLKAWPLWVGDQVSEQRIEVLHCECTLRSLSTEISLDIVWVEVGLFKGLTDAEDPLYGKETKRRELFICATSAEDSSRSDSSRLAIVFSRMLNDWETVRFKNELERNITIKLGYANAKIYKCEEERCPRPMCYKAYGSGKEDSPTCDVPGFESCKMKLLRHVSFVDCPGHDILMATMLNGAAIMDGALLLIAANESCPQPQTSEHLAAVEIMRLQHIIILQNKVDLVQENVAINQHEAIQKFIQGTVADGAPVVPISAQLKYNIDVVCEYIVKRIPIPVRDFTSPPNMIVIRSFDVNKPGFEVDDIRGGVAGGSILKGVLKVNQLIEVRPGIVVKDESGNIKCTPIYSRIVSLFAEQNELQFAVPGGLIGVGTTMDPTLTRADRLVGQVLGEVGSLPEVFVELEVNFFLLRRLLGVRTKDTERQGKVSKLAKGEILMLNIGSMSTGARVVAVKNVFAKLQLTSPVCTSKGEKIALSRRIEKHWRLIGWGQIQAGITLDVPPCPI